MPNTWRVAPALETLRHQLNEAFPKRSKASDGGIGDVKHQSRNSDHNAWVKDSKGKGVVTARDFTHDPKTGIDCQWLADSLVKSKDSRIKYIIWNKQICSSTKAWEWRPYKGVNGHTHHLHLSVNADPKHYDSVRQWKLDFPKEKADDIARVKPDSAAIPLPHSKPAPNPVKEGEVDKPPIDSERPAINVENVENVKVDNAPAPSTTPVTVTSETPSVWAKIGAGVAAITGLGIQFGNIVTTKLSEMTPYQLAYVVAGLAIICLGLWLYDRSARRAHEKTLAKMRTAADPASNTVEIQK